MARFDVYHYAHKTVDLVVEVQADFLSTLNTCVVIPLVTQSKAGSETLPRLKPVIQIHGSEFVLVTTDLAALPRNTLGDFVVNIEEDHRQDIIDALDFLFQGF